MNDFTVWIDESSRVLYRSPISSHYT